MKIDLSALSPPTRLAIAYARSDLHAAWGLLLAFDNRIAGVVGRSSEPIFAQMKIAWWQDALAKPADLRPQGEPLLAELSLIKQGKHTIGLIAAMQLLLEGWGMLAAHEEWTPEILQAFAETRSDAIFGSYATWVGSSYPVAEMGKRWAIADLSARFGEEFGDGDKAPPYRMNRQMRPLTILALSARPELSGTRLIWHALTGR